MNPRTSGDPRRFTAAASHTVAEASASSVPSQQKNVPHAHREWHQGVRSHNESSSTSIRLTPGRETVRNQRFQNPALPAAVPADLALQLGDTGWVTRVTL